MAIINRFIQGLSGKVGLAFIGGYLVAYVLLQYSGLFAPRPENIIRTLHHWPALAGAAAFVLSGMAGIYTSLFVRDEACPSSGNIILSSIAFLGIMLFGAGILLSSLTRFEGIITLSEGQEVSLTAESFDAGTLYRRSFSDMPEGSLLLSEVSQFISDEGKSHGMNAAGLFYRNGRTNEPLELRLSAVFPRFADGVFFRIKDAGYSPRFFLFDLSGNMIEDFYAVLQLSPPGAEDAFRFDKIIPHTFYVRYYPEISLFPDKSDASGIKSGPVFKVRIARNLDIVADQYAAPDDAIYFDKLILSAGAVKKWVEVKVARDPGMYMMWPGVILMFSGPLLLLIKHDI